MCDKICYLPIELELSEEGPFFGNLYNVCLPLPKEQYDYIMKGFEYDGNTVFLTNNSCILRMYSKKYSDIYFMKIVNINTKHPLPYDYPVPIWLFKKVLETENLVPNFDHKKISSIEYNYNVIKIVGEEIPEEIIEFFSMDHMYKERN